MDTLAASLPHVNASLNLIATILLILGSWSAKQQKYDLHRRVMTLCFLVSVAFLSCYLLHKFALHATTGSWNKTFPESAGATLRKVYLAILLSHLSLALLVPPLAIGALVTGWRDRRSTHRKLVKIAWPVWFYVSVTGVVVYVMLYHLAAPS